MLHDKAFNIAKNLKYDEYQRSLASVVYKYFDKKPTSLADKSAFGGGIKSITQTNYQKTQENKSTLNFCRPYLGADLADMQLISNLIKEFIFYYSWVIPLKDKKGITITNPFQQISKESNPKPNKSWVNKGSEFYNGSVKSWLEKIARNIFNT